MHGISKIGEDLMPEGGNLTDQENMDKLRDGRANRASCRAGGSIDDLGDR